MLSIFKFNSIIVVACTVPVLACGFSAEEDFTEQNDSYDNQGKADGLKRDSWWNLLLGNKEIVAVPIQGEEQDLLHGQYCIYERTVGAKDNASSFTGDPVTFVQFANMNELTNKSTRVESNLVWASIDVLGAFVFYSQTAKWMKRALPQFYKRLDLNLDHLMKAYQSANLEIKNLQHMKTILWNGQHIAQQKVNHLFDLLIKQSTAYSHAMNKFKDFILRGTYSANPLGNKFEKIIEHVHGNPQHIAQLDDIVDEFGRAILKENGALAKRIFEIDAYQIKRNIMQTFDDLVKTQGQREKILQRLKELETLSSNNSLALQDAKQGVQALAENIAKDAERITRYGLIAEKVASIAGFFVSLIPGVTAVNEINNALKNLSNSYLEQSFELFSAILGYQEKSIDAGEYKRVFETLRMVSARNKGRFNFWALYGMRERGTCDSQAVKYHLR